MSARTVTRAAAGLGGGARLTQLSQPAAAVSRSLLRTTHTPFGRVSSSLLCCTHHATPLCAARRWEHTAAAPAAGDLHTQLNDLMDSFGEARELIKDAMESVGTTYFGDDMEDAEAQTKDVLKRWADVQAFLEQAGEKDELQKLRNMHELKIKQLEAELETVRDAGGSA